MTVQETIRQAITDDPALRKLRERITAGKATFSDTSAYCTRAAKLLGGLLSKELPGIPLEARESLCTALLHERYLDTNAICDRVQEALDEAQGLHLSPVHAPFNSERAHQIGRATADPTVKPETLRRRAQSAVETAAKAMHDDYIETQARTRARLGLNPVVTRLGTECCAWCASVSGRYRYKDAPKGIFRRHDNCDCTVIYDTQVLRGAVDENGKRTRAWEEVDPKTVQGFEPSVNSREQAAELEARHPVISFSPEQAESLQDSVLTNAAGSGTMETAEERDKNAARRRYDVMTREQRVEVIRRGIREPDATFSYDTAENHAMEYLRKAEPMPNTYDVRSHGNDSLIEFFKQDYPKDDIRSQIDAYTLACILRGREDFRRFLSDCRKRNAEPFVRLMSCNTGNTTNTGNCFAQLLANELGMHVYAPTKTLYANLDGSFQVGIMNDGEMKRFWPRRM